MPSYKQLTNKYKHNTYFPLCSSRCSLSVAILICLIASGISKTNAVPTDSTGGAAHTQLLQRALRDVFAVATSLEEVEATKDTTANASAASSSAACSSAGATSDEILSSPMQPQGQCLLDGMLVAETTVFCEKPVGCRAIQKTGHCCPDYKCDCQKDGKTYSNGDKLVDPETPCTVCYCQGGEILCSPVSCFHRDDCTPKYIAGRCCPEYDSCPVSSPEPSSTTNKTLLDTLMAPNTIRPEVPAAALNHPKITIKEITKPIEIRITDENKAKPIHQMLKPSTHETTTTTTTTAAAAASSIFNEDGVTKATPTQESFSADTNHNGGIGNNNNNNKHILGINNESLKLSASVAYTSTEQSNSNSSIVSSPTAYTSSGSQNRQEMHEIVMVDDRNGGERPFAAFGTQGLQRVDGESANDPSKVNIKREFLDPTAEAPIVNSASKEYASSELIYANPTVSGSIVTNGAAGHLLHNSAELAEPDTAGSDNIYHIILTTDGPRVGSSTENYLALKGSISTEGLSAEKYINDDTFVAAHVTAASKEAVSTEAPLPIAAPTSDATIDDNKQSSVVAVTEDAELLKPFLADTVSESSLSSTTENLHHTSEDEIPVESNPAYPSLPEDDFSLRDVNFPLSENDDHAEADLKDEPRSIGASSSAQYDAPNKSTKHLSDESFINMSTGSGSGMFGSDNDILLESSTWYNMDSSSTEKLEESSGEPSTSTKPLIPLLMYSAEDASEETAVSNATDFQLSSFRLKESANETDSAESLDNVESLEMYMGSGSGDYVATANADVNKAKQREPTTPRPTKKPESLDIDELGSADGAKEPIEDPKLDVESLKLDETLDNGVSQTNAAKKGDVLTVKTNPAQDKAVHDMPEGVLKQLLGSEREQIL